MVRHPCLHPASVAVPGPDTRPAGDAPVRVRRLSQVRAGRQAEYLFELEQGALQTPVRVVRRRRRTMALYVEKGRMAELRVPLNCAWTEVNGFLLSRHDWIRRAQLEVDEKPAGPVDAFHSGGEISYLGKRYRLELVRSRFSTVQIEDDRLVLSCARPERQDLVEARLHQWFRRQAESLFTEILKAQAAAFPDPCTYTGPVIRKMRSRWGSCSRNGEICLNLLLIREALPQIAFVITHELCHLTHFGHNGAFYRLMDQVMPDWREREACLGQGEF